MEGVFNKEQGYGSADQEKKDLNWQKFNREKQIEFRNVQIGFKENLIIE